MSAEIIKTDLKNNSFKSIYFFYGEEEYLKKYYLNELEKNKNNFQQLSIFNMPSEKKLLPSTTSKELSLLDF